MKYEQLSELLERYWDGESSLAEERLLKSYFEGTAVDERLLQFQPLFRALSQSKTVEAPAHLAPKTPLQLGNRSNGIVRRLLAAATLTGIIASSWWWTRSGVADKGVASLPEVEVVAPLIQAAPATVPVVEAVIPIKRPIRAKRPQMETEIQPEEAAAIIKSALALVSSKIKQGKTGAEKHIIKVKVLDQFVKHPQEG